MGKVSVPEWVGAVTVTAGFVWAAAVRPLLKQRDDNQTTRMKLNEILSDLAAIKGELHTNGGSSLRDAVNRVEQGTNEVKTRLDEHIRFHLEEGRR